VPPLPHAWIDDEHGRRRPVKDLVAPGRFLLIAGEDGQAWCTAARQLAAEADVPLDALRIGHLDGDLYDPHCTWLRHRQIASDGAILVGPDRFIAWRCPAGEVPRDRRPGRTPVTTSFPSGHAAAAAAFATGVGLEMPALAAPVGALAAAVGISRVVNGVHYPSDIAGGWAFGAGVGMLTLRWWPLRQSQPAAASAA
jgi:hypothetical protein